ncbi:hypothetical protein HAPAU_09400 [Halalkalicoccus paucihalophilus]|uniref:Uncharacterized protein n=1 Tax=Halalkalicoccus paucihalophilus TaxID=1008153 RepID=A0A151AHQ5_9EURY|nr:DUF5783 family protein [Halalkalicoccus paucihalophilus]KYH27050.1 hypothetical protein HAPAU_09400 [Halalkalicoccus paucihalophilus]
MTEFDPEKFEEKYVHYFNELQRAYKNAFEYMNERYDSELVHAIDQQVLNESEPQYDEERGEFSVDLPESPYDRLGGVIVERERFEGVLDTYVERIEEELHRVLGVEH